LYVKQKAIHSMHGTNGESCIVHEAENVRWSLYGSKNSQSLHSFEMTNVNVRNNYKELNPGSRDSVAMADDR
jgi:hypothetical protein